MNHLEILQALEAKGHEAYIVGGAVRDKLLEFPVKDYDLATSARPEEIKEIFGKQAKLIFSHSGAPVVNVGQIEVASFRSETGFRKNAEFKLGTLEEDAKRRDFTVNALYEDLRGGIKDPTGEGLFDLRSNILKFVGNPLERISEDPTRILRGVRLVSQKALILDVSFVDAVRAAKEKIYYIAIEQIGRELRKMVQSSEIVSMMHTMHGLGILEIILPAVYRTIGVKQNDHHKEGDVFTHTMMVLKNCSIDNELVKWAAIFHDLGKVETAKLEKGKWTFHAHEEVSAKIAEAYLKKFSVFSKQEKNTIVWLVQNHMRGHSLPEASRRKQAEIFRHPDARLLLNLLEADTLGRIPCAGDKFEKVKQLAEKFWAEDKLLTDLGINGNLVKSLEDPAKIEETRGRIIGTKLGMMQAILTKNPRKSKEDLLKAVGLKNG